MKYDNFKKIAKIYELEDNENYTKSVAVLLDDETSKEEKNSARATILKEVTIKLVDNDVLVGYMTDEEKEKLLNLGEKCSNKPESTKNFTMMLNKLVEYSTNSYEKFTIASIIAKLNEIASEYQITGISILLDKIKEDSTETEKRAIISKAYTVLNNKVNEKNEKLDENNRTDLESLNELNRKVVELLNNTESDIFELYYHAMEDIQKSLEALILVDKKSKKGIKNIKVNISKRGKKIIAGVVAAALLTTGGIIVYNNVKKDDGKVDGDNPKTVTDTDKPYISKGNGGIVPDETTTQESVNSDEIPTQNIANDTDISEIAEKLYTNWKALGLNYELSEIEELLRFTYGLDSNVNINTIDKVAVDVINAATIPAVNNALMGSKTLDTAKLNISGLLPTSMNGYSKVETMENYLNELITDSDNIETYGKIALLEEIKTNFTGTQDMDPVVRILWARIAEVGINPIIGTLGKDFSVEINGVSYNQEIANNPDIYENIVNEVLTSFTK